MKTALHVKIDKDVRDRAQLVAKKIGIPMSTAVNALLKKFIWEEKLELTMPPARLRPEIMKELRQIEEEVKQGKNLSRPMKNKKELHAYLNSL